MRSYRTVSPLPECCHPGGLFSVALSVNAPPGGVARVYLRPDGQSYAASRPDGVRTFLLPLARKAILRLPKIVRKVTVVGVSSKRFGKNILILFLFLLLESDCRKTAAGRARWPHRAAARWEWVRENFPSARAGAPSAPAR